jgi:hypothetical protein
MRKLSIIFSILFCLFSIIPLKAQNLLLKSSDISACYGSNKINKIYIPPPKEFFERGQTKGASIQVIYNGFPDDAKAAMQYAVSVLSSMLPKDTKFTINATMQIINDAGVLGRTSISGYLLGSYIDAWKPFAYYPIALGEKIAASSYNNDTVGDIDMTFNRRANWYNGTDGNTPTNKYDFVTVIIHEIIHGLGFTSSMNTNDTIGWYGINSVPFIYDTFIENLSGKRLTDTLTFQENSKSLYQELTSGLIYFNGPLLKNFTSGNRARLYAPATWDGGSSISHLDETTPQADALMSPFVGFGEAIHNPGKLTLSILGDVGWVNTKIFNAPFKDTEEHLTEVTFSARIKSDTLYNHNFVGLVYSFNKFATSDTAYLVSPNANDSFRIKLNIPSYGLELSYYFFAKDCFNRIYRSPSLGSKSPSRFYIGIDTVKPVLVPRPVNDFPEKNGSVEFATSATDNLGIDTVYIEYKVNSGVSKFLGLSYDSLDIYSKILNVKPFLFKAGDSIQYRFIALDKANIPNQRIMPSSGYYSVHVTKIMSTVTSYITNFNSPNEDFANNGFSIIQPALFNSPALHTKHPYESPEVDGASIEYTSILLHPIVIAETGMVINFKEIVLVEPGEPGSVFGSPDFYDYVILEGSKNYGKTWFPLAPGYDSRIAPSFLTAYNSSIVGQNSTAVGKEDMYQPHSIDLRSVSSITKGDTIMVRFRLYSDPFAYGWGWALDDLNITAVPLSVGKVYTSPFLVYPNPGNGLLTVDAGEIGSGKQVPYRILNSGGSQIFTGNLNGGTLNTIDISNQPSGIYLIVVYRDDGIMTIKYSLIK